MTPFTQAFGLDRQALPEVCTSPTPFICRVLQAEARSHAMRKYLANPPRCNKPYPRHPFRRLANEREMRFAKAYLGRVMFHLNTRWSGGDASVKREIKDAWAAVGKAWQELEAR